jgi:hypothetical protein
VRGRAAKNTTSPGRRRPGRAIDFLLMKLAVFLICCLSLIGCRTLRTESAPVIEFTKIPPADEGGPDKVDTIEGRVSGARPAQKIVLYAKSGSWWVQPYANQPLTEIRPDDTWQSSTHLGTEYAALLVDAEYRPPVRMDLLPPAGEGVIAVASVKGAEAPEAAPKTLKFSGYDWKIRTTASDRGGAMNHYDPANVWTDEKGFLHLRIRRAAGDAEQPRWTCAELSLTRSLGYGTYNLVVQDVSRLEPAAVLSMFTWDDLEAGQNHREMNLEVTRWGDPSNKNLRYVVQPFYVPTNVAQFAVPAGTLTHSMRWAHGKAEFRTVAGSLADASPKTVSAYEFASGVPAAGGETVHLILYVFGYSKQPLQNETEVIIEKFEFLP